MLDQRRHVGQTIAQRRHPQHVHVEPIEQILAEASLGDFLLEVAVCRRHDAGVYVDRLVAAQPRDFPLFEHAEQLCLCGGRQVADFVQEQRAAARCLERALAGGVRAGERAALVPEQLALDQLVRQRRTVERDEWGFGIGA